MEIAWQVEVDPWCQSVLTHHWPDVPKHGDIDEIRAGELGAVDVIAGGFPCQPVSVAGGRELQADSRWLWPSFARVVREVGPRYILVENVPGLASGGMGDVLGELAEMGYHAEWASLPAYLFGARHLRWRIFIAAYSDGAALWDESGRESGSVGEGQALFGYDGQAELVAGSARAECWATEPGVGRVADGVPDRVARLRALGNAVCPAVAEWIGRRLMAVDRVRG